MAVYFVTGKLGSGKTLCAVWRIALYLQARRRVATNLDLCLEAFPNCNLREMSAIRLPDKPTAEDLHAMGKGNDTYDEDKNGLLVLDECGTWFNSRTWSDKSRAAVIDWFLHARKLGWDVIFIVQDIDIVDRQARDALAEHVVYCKRLDRLNIPLIGWIIKSLGIQKVLPRLHWAVVKYGDTRQHPTVDRWIYRGNEFFKMYDTKQAFKPELRSYVLPGSAGLSSYLSPWHLRGRLGGRRTFRQVLAHSSQVVAGLFTFAVVVIHAASTGRSSADAAKSLGLLKREHPPLVWRDGPILHG